MAAMPAAMPPPPIGTKDRVDRARVLAQDFADADGARPAITSGSSYGCTNVAPSCSDGRVCRRRRMNRHAAPLCPLPRLATALTLMRGVVAGITMVAVQPRICAIRHALRVVAGRSATRRHAIQLSLRQLRHLLKAPRSLNENTGCMSSRFSNTVADATRQDRRRLQRQRLMATS